MTREEYLKSSNSVIGICEICHYFSQCAKEGTLKEDGCEYHSNYQWED